MSKIKTVVKKEWPQVVWFIPIPETGVWPVDLAMALLVPIGLMALIRHWSKR